MIERSCYLYEVATKIRRQIFEDLNLNQPPSLGIFDPNILKEGRKNGLPQMGSMHFEPWQIILEYIYPNPSGATVVLPVSVPTEERIVYLPVPEWVIENIWEGEVSGTYEFESRAQELLANLQTKLSADENGKLFHQETKKVKS